MAEDDEMRSGEGGEAPPIRNEALVDDATALHDADTDKIVALLADLGSAQEGSTAGFTVEVAFGDGGDVLVTDEDADVDVDAILAGKTSESATAPSTTPVAEDTRDTASTEIAHSLENGSVPIDALPIKVIFDDDGSASGHSL